MDIQKILNKYYSGRFYHNEKHVLEMLSLLNNYKLNENEYDILKAAILFHDCIYDPKKADNEELSCSEFLKCCPEYKNRDAVCKLIMETKHNNYSDDKLSEIIISLDLNVFNKGIVSLIEYEHQIFKEYQFANLKEYIEKRTSFLINFIDKLKLNDRFSKDRINDIFTLIEYIKNRRYKIGIYPGSFNPFHIGHLNIVNKAEKVFDKVVIAIGINPDKSGTNFELPQKLPNEIIQYSGLVTELFESKPENADYYLIRGLRNVYDLGYEENMRKVVQDIRPDIEFIYFFCDSKYEHVSSSIIRGLLKFNSNEANKYLT